MDATGFSLVGKHAGSKARSHGTEAQSETKLKRGERGSSARGASPGRVSTLTCPPQGSKHLNFKVCSFWNNSSFAWESSQECVSGRICFTVQHGGAHRTLSPGGSALSR